MVFDKILRYINLNSVIELSTNKPFREIFLGTLEKYHLYDFILPFMLGYVVTYTALNTTKIFLKDDNDTVGKRLNVLTAFSLAVYLTTNKQIVQGIITLSSSIMLFILAILAFLIVYSFASEKDVTKIPFYIRVPLLIALLAIVFPIYFGVFFPIVGESISIAPFLKTIGDALPVIVILGVMILFIYYISK